MPDTVVLTRRPEDNAGLAAELRAQGLEVVELPCIRIEPLTESSELAREIASLRRIDVLVMTSAAGVDAVARLGIPVTCDVAAVGPATASRARSAGMSVTFVSPEHTSAVLGRMLPLPTGNVVLARSDRADGELPAVLQERGASVRAVIAYRTVAELSCDADVGRAVLAKRPVVVVASPSAVHALRDAFGVAALGRARFVSIGPRTAAAVHEAIGVTSTIVSGLDAQAIATAARVKAQEVIA